METSKKTGQAIVVSEKVRFYTITDLADMLNWCEPTVQKLFNDPYFPSCDFGRSKVVEVHALIEYFSKKHSKENEKYWNH